MFSARSGIMPPALLGFGDLQGKAGKARRIGRFLSTKPYTLLRKPSRPQTSHWSSLERFLSLRSKISAIVLQISRFFATQGVEESEMLLKGWNWVSRRMKRSAQMLKLSEARDFGFEVTIPRTRPLSCSISATIV